MRVVAGRPQPDWTDMAEQTASHRRRIAAGLAAPAVLGGVAALVAVAVTGDRHAGQDRHHTGRDDQRVPRHGEHRHRRPGATAPPRRQARHAHHARRHDAARGDVRGLQQPLGRSGGQRPPRDAGKDYAAFYIEYPPAHMASYEDAVEAGVDNTQSVMQAIRAECPPDTQFAIVGYSEGADVARRAAMEIGNQTPNADARTTSSTRIPWSASSSSPTPDAPPARARSPPVRATPLPQSRRLRPRIPVREHQRRRQRHRDRYQRRVRRLDGKIASFCSDGDFTCDAPPENIALIQLAANVGRSSTSTDCRTKASPSRPGRTWRSRSAAWRCSRSTTSHRRATGCSPTRRSSTS